MLLIDLPTHERRPSLGRNGCNTKCLFHSKVTRIGFFWTYTNNIGQPPYLSHQRESELPISTCSSLNMKIWPIYTYTVCQSLAAHPQNVVFSPKKMEEFAPLLNLLTGRLHIKIHQPGASVCLAPDVLLFTRKQIEVQPKQTNKQ